MGNAPSTSSRATPLDGKVLHVANAVAPIRRRQSRRNFSSGGSTSRVGRSRWPDLLLEKYAGRWPNSLDVYMWPARKSEALLACLVLLVLFVV